MKSLIRYVMIAMMAVGFALPSAGAVNAIDRKSTRLNSSHPK